MEEGEEFTFTGAVVIKVLRNTRCVAFHFDKRAAAGKLACLWSVVCGRLFSVYIGGV